MHVQYLCEHDAGSVVYILIYIYMDGMAIKLGTCILQNAT